MSIQMFVAGVLIGSVTRSGKGTVYARGPDGLPIGCFADVDAATAELMRRARP